MGFIITLLKGQINNHPGPHARSGLNSKLSTHTLRPLAHSLEAKVESIPHHVIYYKTLATVFDGHLGRPSGALDLDFTSRCLGMLKDVGEGLMNNTNELDLYLRREPDDLSSIDLEIHRDFSQLAKVVKILGKSRDKAKTLGNHSPQAKDGLAHILVNPIGDLAHLL